MTSGKLQRNTDFCNRVPNTSVLFYLPEISHVYKPRVLASEQATVWLTIIIRKKKNSLCNHTDIKYKMLEAGAWWQCDGEVHCYSIKNRDQSVELSVGGHHGNQRPGTREVSVKVERWKLHSMNTFCFHLSRSFPPSLSDILSLSISAPFSVSSPTQTLSLPLLHS